jgi:hypothetical protein
MFTFTVSHLEEFLRITNQLAPRYLEMRGALGDERSNSVSAVGREMPSVRCQD